MILKNQIQKMWKDDVFIGVFGIVRSENLDGENTFYLPRQYMSFPNGRILV